MKIVDDKNKKLTLLSLNFFFATTFIIITANILLFLLLDVGWDKKLLRFYDIEIIDQIPTQVIRPIDNFLIAFFASFSHGTLEHVLMNMLCFLICGLYLERRVGSIKLFILIIALCFFAGFATIATLNSNNIYGFSWVVYALYGYIIIDYLLFLIKPKGNLLNLILGGATMLVIVATFFSSDGKSWISFSTYPKNLFMPVHWPGLAVGMAIAILSKINLSNRAQCANIFKHD